MAMVYVTISAEVEVDDELIESFEDSAFAWAADSVSLDFDGGRHLTYWVDDVDTDY